LSLARFAFRSGLAPSALAMVGGKRNAASEDVGERCLGAAPPAKRFSDCLDRIHERYI
jgi:hypothetical protein